MLWAVKKEGYYGIPYFFIHTRLVGSIFDFCCEKQVYMHYFMLKM